MTLTRNGEGQGKGGDGKGTIDFSTRFAVRGERGDGTIFQVGLLQDYRTKCYAA